MRAQNLTFLPDPYDRAQGLDKELVKNDREVITNCNRSTRYPSMRVRTLTFLSDLGFYWDVVKITGSFSQ